MRILYCAACVATLVMSWFGAAAQVPVSTGPDGKLFYTPDEQGNRIPDFSYSGYMAGAAAIPDVPVKIVVPVKQGDATLRIQSALDYVATLPADGRGIRGAVLLQKGRYEVHGSLEITSSGVVLRGSGMGADGTILAGSGKDRHNLVTIAGVGDQELEEPVLITDKYVPVNATEIHVQTPGLFKAGDRAIIKRPSSQPWIDALGMREFGGETEWLGWKPGERDILWDRQIVAVNNTSLTFDAPVTTALDPAYGGGYIMRYTWPGRIRQVGVENMQCISEYDRDNPKDEAHRWMAITLENVRDAWVRQVVFKHFAGSAVAVWETASRVTVEDCKSLAPVSEIGGQRRYTFFTAGQQTLFQRLYAEHGYHDFATGFCAAGPNAFVQCRSYLPHSFSGAIDSWASGVLFDVVNVDGQALRFANRGQDAQGAGWCAANSVFWQCSASQIDCYKPPTAANWAFGAWAQFAGDGYWHEANSHVKPWSLYYAQLRDRLGEEVMKRAFLMEPGTEASSSPTVEQAADLNALAATPAASLTSFIDQAATRQPIPVTHDNVKTVEQIEIKQAAAPHAPAPVQVVNGRMLQQDKLLTGGRTGVQWWRGDVRPHERKKAGPHITRFVPGRTGPGLTDDLQAATDKMLGEHIVALEHNYGLWYDRRRDDHERVRRMNGEVWPPFYELPFARSGQGAAWDGLSKYDLTTYNHWYWSRLKQFADLAGKKGLLLIHQQYFQHNILEAGAHWADFPWRPANNINDTGFPEPPPYAGDKRIFMDGRFYDVTHPGRRKLHEAYIRQCLDAFAGNTNVIHFISAEYTGPLHFVQFWIDTIIEWEKETGQKATVGLSVTKDVQDAILADPARAQAVDLIDIRYWHYREDGTRYAPQGGQHLAPRQHARLVKPGNLSFEQVYRAVKEYRDAYPDKAVIYSARNYDRFGWAVLMAGGSLPDIPHTVDTEFLDDAGAMRAIDMNCEHGAQYALWHKERGYIVYARKQDHVNIDLTGMKGSFKAVWLDPGSGKVLKKEPRLKGGKTAALKTPGHNDVVLWVTRQK